MKKDVDKPDPKPTDAVAEVVMLAPNEIEGARKIIQPLAGIDLEVGTKLFRYSAKVWHSYPDKPIDMILHCPRCHTQHVDAPDDSRGPIKCQRTPECAEPCGEWCGWTNPPHRSHKCHHCNMIWRPADVYTNGVEKIKTKGANDTLVLRRRKK